MRIGLLGDIHAQDDRLEIALTDLQSMKLDVILFVGDVLNGPGSVNRCIDLLQSHDVICIKGNHDIHIPTEQSERVASERSQKNFEAINQFFNGGVDSKTDQDLNVNIANSKYTKVSQINDNSRAFIENLPTHREIATPDGLLLLCHGMGTSVYELVNDIHFDNSENINPKSEFQRILTEKKYSFVVSGHTHAVLARRHEGIAFFNAGSLCGGGYAGYCVLDTEKSELEVYRFWQEKRRLKGPIRISC